MTNTSAPLLDPGSSESTSTPSRLDGNLGTTSLVLSVLAFSAPIVTVAGYMAFAIAFVGESAPLAWVIAMAVLLVFAVGYTTMTRHIPRPGAFYAYISLGLGKVGGVGSAFLATLSYIVIVSGVYVFAGVTIASVVQSFGGPATPWWMWTAACWVLVTTLAYFHIELSARVLVVVMALEVVLVLIFNVFTIARGGADGISLKPLDPSAFLNPGAGLALLFAFSTFIGFEATALYRDEVRQPKRTVPRATYLSVILIGLFYGISCYSMVTAYGSSAVERAVTSPTDMFNDALDTYVYPGFSTISLLLVSTSAIAALLSIHNVVARYLHNLGVDRALPKYLAAVHPRHTSPYKASISAGILVAIVLAPFAVGGVDPTILIGSGSGIGTAGVLVLMAIVSLAVVVWFVKNGRPPGETAWRTFVAPLISVIVLGAIVVFAIVRFDLLVGGAPGENLWMLLIPLGVFLAGCGVALFYRARRPDLYRLLGRADRS